MKNAFYFILKALFVVKIFMLSSWNFEINLNFLIKPFFYIMKTSSQKYKYIEKERSF